MSSQVFQTLVILIALNMVFSWFNTVSTRTTRPAHFLFKIESFTKLVEILGKSSDAYNYESPEFECDGHKWLVILPYSDYSNNSVISICVCKDCCHVLMIDEL